MHNGDEFHVCRQEFYIKLWQKFIPDLDKVEYGNNISLRLNSNNEENLENPSDL